MAHYNSYDSFQTKRSKEKKERAKKNSYLASETIDNHSGIEYGIVVEVTYQNALVSFKKQMIEATYIKKNIPLNKAIFTGDKVIIEKQKNSYVITDILNRTSILARSHKDGTKINGHIDQKIVATNIDIAVIVVSAKEPPLHHKFIDRYLLLLKSSDIPSVICLNKCDLMTNEEQKILDVYSALDIPIIKTSAQTGYGINELKNILTGKLAIFVGNSGVGKSSLTKLITGNDIKTNMVARNNRGRHTTTTSHYYEWKKDSQVIDTPGIRSLDITGFTPKDIEDFFDEFKEYNDQCKYADCLHYTEPEESCKIKQCVHANIISPLRYNSYIKMLEDILGK